LLQILKQERTATAPMRGTTLEHGEQARLGHAEDHSTAHVLGYARSSVFGSCETLCSSNRLDILERASAPNLRVQFSGLDALTS